VCGCVCEMGDDLGLLFLRSNSFYVSTLVVALRSKTCYMRNNDVPMGKGKNELKI
jgi:hypothetical protein